MITSMTQTNRVIFAADDDADDLTLLRLLLRKAGVEVPLQIFRDGEEVIAAFSKLLRSSVRALQPILCFLDVRLPDGSGFDVLRWIRAQSQFDHVPIVMLTGSESPRDITAAVQNGAQCYITKYPQPATLRELVGDAERFALGAPADECFRMPTNQLLVRCRRLSDKR